MAARAASLRQQIGELTGGREAETGLPDAAPMEEVRMGRPRATQRPRTAGLRHVPSLQGNAQSRH